MLREHICEMVSLFYGGRLDISRLNFGSISLIPKIKDANNIKRYRPICLLNVVYKIIMKVLTQRLTYSR